MQKRSPRAVWTSVKRLGFVFATCALLLPACGGSNLSERPSPERQVRLLVVNNNWLDARVYVTTGATTRSLGLITTGNELRFRIPFEFVGRNDAILVANLVGSRTTFRTESLYLVAGQLIVLTLEEPIDRSWITIRE